MNTRVKNIWLLARILLKAVFVGNADKLPKEIKRIIVVPTGKLGDVVCTTPVLVALRKHFPQAKILLYPDSKLHRELLADSGLVDEYVSDPQSAKADVALVTGPTFELIAPLYLADISFIAAPRVEGGISSQVTKPYRILLRFLKQYSYRMRQYAPRERLRCLEPLAIYEDETAKNLRFPDEALKKISKHFTPEQFVVGMTPTAGHKIKEWPLERFAQVADYLAEKYQARVFVIGGPTDKPQVDKLMSLIRSKENVDSLTDLSIGELKALISKLNLFISVDTGPIYIAEAFNVPTVDITGPIDENEQPPRGPYHRNVVSKEREKPELFVLNAKSYNKQEALRQRDSIAVSQVTETIDELISSLENAKSA